MLVIYNKYWLWTSEDTKYTKMQQPKVQEWGSPQYPASYWDWLNCKMHPKKIHFIWEHQLAHGYFQASRGPFVKERNCLINRTPRIKPMLTMAPSPPLEKTGCVPIPVMRKHSLRFESTWLLGSGPRCCFCLQCNAHTLGHYS